MLKRITGASIAGMLLAAIVGVGAAAAHESRRVGEFTMVVGFLDEPVFSGQKSGLDLRVSRGDAPIEGLEETLQAEVIFEGPRPGGVAQIRRAGGVPVGLFPHGGRPVHFSHLR